VTRVAILFLCLLALLVVWRYSSRQPEAPVAATQPRSARVEGSTIYFVPIGDFPREQFDPLVRYYRQKYGLDITVLKSIPADPATRDASRQQLMAENLAASVHSAFPEHASDPKAILIGVTSEDMYPVSKNWQFAFTWRSGANRTAVVSTARLRLPNTADSSDPDVPGTRLRKMVTKDIGLLYYGLAQSADPKSVLYNQIMGIEELDNVGEDF
jgi:predicted Zn-dependent protease